MHLSLSPSLAFAQRSAVEERGGFARVRPHGLDLQLEVADLRARLAQLRRQLRVLLLERGDVRVLSTARHIVSVRIRIITIVEHKHNRGTYILWSG